MSPLVMQFSTLGPDECGAVAAVLLSRSGLSLNATLAALEPRPPISSQARIFVWVKLILLRCQCALEVVLG